MFWYEDVLLNEELTPVIGEPWKGEGEVVDISKIDDYTVKLEFSDTRPFFMKRTIKFGAWDFYFPKHYLKQFHPKYNSKEKVEKMAEEAGFDSWYQYFEDRNLNIWGMSYNLERPTLTSYMLKEKSSDRRVWERNPYFWKIDTEGNQLPYVKEIITEIVTDVEVVQGMIMSGDIDFAGMQTDIRNYPMYKKYEGEGNYKTKLWETGMGSDVIYMLNLTHKDPQIREIFQNVKFRRALSIGIDREEINNSIYFGRAEPRQMTVVESSQLFEPEFEKAYTEYNPEDAKKMLDEIGLEDQDGDGWRELPSGDDFNFTIEFVSIETPKTPNVELVTQHWQALGINVNSKNISGELSGQRAPANMMDSCIWHGDKATDLLFYTQPQFFVPEPPGWERTIWPQWGRWFQTDGESGDEPPAKVKRLRGWYEDMIREPNEEKRMELAKNIVRSQAENLWTIGTIGKSPFPFVLGENLINFPEEGYACWDTIWSRTRDPEQIFFENQ